MHRGPPEGSLQPRAFRDAIFVRRGRADGPADLQSFRFLATERHLIVRQTWFSMLAQCRTGLIKQPNFLRRSPGQGKRRQYVPVQSIACSLDEMQFAVLKSSTAALQPGRVSLTISRE